MPGNSMRALLKIVVVYDMVFIGIQFRDTFKTPSNIQNRAFGKKSDEYKPLANYFCKKAPPWMFGRVLNTSVKFMLYYIFYAIVVSKKQKLHKSNDEYCLWDVTGSRDIKDINQKASILWE